MKPMIRAMGDRLGWKEGIGPFLLKELPSKTGALLGIGLFHRLGDLRHEIGDPRQPRREHVEQRCYAREQENRRQRHLDDMGDQVE